MAGQGRRPGGVRLLAVLLILLAVNALVGGALLIADPSGGLLGMPVSLLAGSPFRDYLLPGLVLFGLLGVLPLAVVAGVWFRPRWAYLDGMGVHGAWLAAMGVGAGQANVLEFDNLIKVFPALASLRKTPGEKVELVAASVAALRNASSPPSARAQ